MLHLAQNFGMVDHSAPSLNEVVDTLGLGPGLEIVETPSSWVILTDRHAFKWLRLVEAEDSPYASPEGRRKWCAEEIWRNERLAPSVYLGIVTLARGRDGKLRMGGKGLEVEWIVKMRRLRSDHNLRALIRHRQVCRTQIAVVANAMTAFYQAGSPQHDQVDELIARVQLRINDAAKTLIENLPAKAKSDVRRLRDAQRAFLSSARADFNMRVCDGRIVDGHGELLPEHIFLERETSIIGAQAHAAVAPKLDAIDDLGLLAMECEHLGRQDIADEIMATYRRANADEGSPRLESFYMSLHACRRAADRFIFAGRLRNVSNEECIQEAKFYLERAKSYAKRFEGNA
jgi:aminoglycoside phosphotransferase family enzyme